MAPCKTDFDVICLSHLRWDFVYQRPQHLMTRFAAVRRVFYIEEPVWENVTPHFEVRLRQSGVHVVVPHMAHAEATEISENLRRLLDRFIADQKIVVYCLWYYTPMAISWTRHLKAVSIIYDCMDELSAFRGAAAELREREFELFESADVVFTGGYTLFESKRKLHPNVYPFPSSIDLAHFAQARSLGEEPEDQASISPKKIGYCGVIDERMDLHLLRSIAQARPDWQFVMIGPVVKISESDLPRERNIHYLGMKQYEQLPAYMAGWEAAILPFARNESTRFISPTKTPEYLAAGRPVVSTSIADVVRPYGDLGLVHIANQPEEFVAALQEAMTEDCSERMRKVDEYLSQNCWSRTWRRMAELIEDTVLASGRVQSSVPPPTRPAEAMVATGGNI